MQAIVSRRYGPPDVLRLEEREKPTPGDNEVLIKVRAAAINPLDWHLMRGMPYGFRFTTGLRKPKDTRLGMDFSGEVEALGNNVTKLKLGDQVFGACRGSLAEFVCAPESVTVLKPVNVTFEQAAATPVAALTALQGLRDKGQLRSGQKVLINGASGGVGTFAVQLARSLGAEVTAVCSTRNVDLVRSLGAHAVIDYTRDKFTQAPQRYDVLLDCIGNHSLSACRRILNPTGIYVMVGGPSGRWIAPMGRVLRMLVLSRFVPQKLLVFMAQVNAQDLTLLSDLMASEKLIPVIDRRYPLSDVSTAMRYLEQGHARGKILITVGH
jgi:NADPH:quinone reductase-like Zn-dependent oxidoreductase